MVNSEVGFNINRINGGKYATSSRESTLNLTRTNINHLVGETDPNKNAVSNAKGISFEDLLVGQIDTIASLESKAEALTTQFIVDPESVNEHDVTIASTEATLAVNIATTVVNKAIEAYKSIMSMG